MKHLLTLISCCLALSLSAQELVVDYPYNPDYENDGNVGVEDLLQLLAYFDMGFEVDDIVIDEVTLTQWLQTISQTLINQQATIDSLQGLTSALDSTMVADMIAAAGGVGSGGGCDYQFPDGLDGDAVVWDFTNNGDYNVPIGKNLYILYLTASTPVTLIADGKEVAYTANNILGVTSLDFGYDQNHSFTQPLIFNEGTVVTMSNISGYRSFSGILIDKVVDPVLLDLHELGTYSIPIGKSLYILSSYGKNANPDLIIDGIHFMQIMQGINFYDLPLIINSVSQLSLSPSNAQEINLIGYLVDEDYFADCGGGGSSDGFIQGLAFGERVNLGEPEDWGPLPWDAYVNYGVYDFESDGLVMGQLSYPFYNVELLPDSLDVQDLSHEVFDEHIVASFDGQEAFTIAVRADEKLVIEGMPYAFEDDYVIQWIPLISGDSSNDNNDVTPNNSGPCQGGLTVNYHGYDYELVEIGDQCWFAENLRTDKFSNGDLINEAFGLNFPPAGVAHCDSEAYGFVYNAAAAKDDRNVCPSGWKVPSANDFSKLLSSTMGQNIQFGTHGFNGQTAGVLQSELAVDPNGGCNIASVGNTGAILLTDVSSDTTLVWKAHMNTEVYMIALDLEWYGISIRCIKD